MYDTAMLAGRNIAYMCKSFVINACGTISPEMRSIMEVTEGDRNYLDDPKSLGGSTIIDPYGRVIAGPAGPGDEIIYADADLTDTVRAKLVHDFAGHYQRHDVFQFEINPSAPHLPPNPPLSEVPSEIEDRLPEDFPRDREPDDE
jgi:aliphatic nitrilase